MPQFEVIFYERENGACPVEEFMLQLDTKMRAKLTGLLEILAENGNQLREPYSKPIEDGIFELRCKVGSNIRLSKKSFRPKDSEGGIVGKGTVRVPFP